MRLDAVNTFGIEMHNYIADTALSPLEELIRKEDEELGRRGCGAGDGKRCRAERDEFPERCKLSDWRRED